MAFKLKQGLIRERKLNFKKQECSRLKRKECWRHQKEEWGIRKDSCLAREGKSKAWSVQFKSYKDWGLSRLIVRFGRLFESVYKCDWGLYRGINST